MKENGFVALISVLAVGAVGLAVGISLILLGLGASKTSLVLDQSSQAKALSNACSEEALEKIRDSNSFSGSGALSLGNGNCAYTVTKLTGQNRTATASGTIGTIVRKVHLTIDQVNPSINITSWQEVVDF